MLRRAVALSPQFADAYRHLAWTLRLRGKFGEAETSLQKAIELDPKNEIAHVDLGIVLYRQDKLAEAEAVLRKAVAINHQFADAHGSLGWALYLQGKFAEAETSLRKAIDLDAKNGTLRAQLGLVLEKQEKWLAAAAAYRAALDLDPNNNTVRTGLSIAERLAALAPRLPAFLKGEDQPRSNDERLGFIRLCQLKRHYRTSASLYADAFAADPKLVDEPNAFHRYNAACFAALAASGKGEDAGTLDENEKARLRGQAFDWLRSDLAMRKKQLQSSKPTERAAAQSSLRHWQKDSDLAGVREPAPLSKLSKVEGERWRGLWEEVAALLAEARKAQP